MYLTIYDGDWKKVKCLFCLFIVFFKNDYMGRSVADCIHFLLFPGGFGVS